MRYSPWADAAERHPDIHIERCDIAPTRGVWVPSEHVILLDVALDMAGRRTTLAHELAHIDLDHHPANGWFGRRMEHDADRLAAQRLLGSVEDIADAICVHPIDPDKVAEHLGITLCVLRRRLSLLTGAEKTYIEQRLANRENGA